MFKKCSRCKKYKDILEYGKNNRKPDKLNTRCKDCCCVVSGEHRDNPKNIAKHLFWGAKERSYKNNIEFNIEISDITIPDYCPILGIPIKTCKNKASPNSPSLDRMDNTKGYIKGNVVVISWRANRLKSDATIDEIRKLAEFYT